MYSRQDKKCKDLEHGGPGSGKKSSNPRSLVCWDEDVIVYYVVKSSGASALQVALSYFSSITQINVFLALWVS